MASHVAPGREGLLRGGDGIVDVLFAGDLDLVRDEAVVVGVVAGEGVSVLMLTSLRVVDLHCQGLASAAFDILYSCVSKLYDPREQHPPS